MIRLVASDLDGTLLNARHRMDATIRRSLGRVLAAGAHFSVATGRFMASNGAYGFDGLPCEAVSSNGAVIYDRTGELVMHHSLDLGFVEALLREFPAISAEFTVVDGGSARMLVPGPLKEHLLQMRPASRLKRIARALSGPVVDRTAAEYRYEVPVAEILASDVCKLTFRVHDEARRREVLSFLASWSHAVVNAPSSPTLFEVTNVGVDKGTAVAWLAGYLGIGPDEVAVYGDGGNDCAMLRRFADYGHAFAPSSGSAAAREAASEVIGPCALHAVAHHMVRLVGSGDGASTAASM